MRCRLPLVLLLGATLGCAADRSVAELAPRWAPPPSRLDSIGGMLVHWRDEGPRDDSLPVVLLHGTAASLHTWDGWTSELARTRRVVRMDLPGFALSDPFADGDYTSANYLRFVRRVLDHLGLGRVVVAGNSFGGELAWMLAAEQPERVAALILVDAAGYPMRSTSVPIAFRMARTRGLDQVVRHVTPEPLVRSSVRNVYGDPDRVDDALVQRYRELVLRAGNRDALVRRLNLRQGASDTTVIAGIRTPTLILWGGRDRLIPPDMADQFARDIPGSRIVRFDALGHVPHEEDPAASLVPVREFLARVAPR